MKELVEVFEGKRKNEIDINGKKIEATRFIVKDKNGKETIIDFKDMEKEKKEIPIPSPSKTKKGKRK